MAARWRRKRARSILRSAIEAQHPVTAGKGLGSRIHAHFAQLGGTELELPERSSLPTPAEFESGAELES